ncbi:hypothetical protein DSOL_5396 [Desulfosporosinus metallidurans]|uniref:Uncharacterized protein n=1 Tax=Desulfosporosinus metallidurans TaxID=1888891 RepID=A0A1Q8QC37_9FIRM|nr:hypothetical protein DSOL_5396 [Desulfosporosinus metallidurans]
MLFVEAIQATTKVLWTSIPQQMGYTIFKPIGRLLSKCYRDRQH